MPAGRNPPELSIRDLCDRFPPADFGYLVVGSAADYVWRHGAGSGSTLGLAAATGRELDRDSPALELALVGHSPESASRFLKMLCEREPYRPAAFFRAGGATYLFRSEARDGLATIIVWHSLWADLRQLLDSWETVFAYDGATVWTAPQQARSLRGLGAKLHFKSGREAHNGTEGPALVCRMSCGSARTARPADVALGRHAIFSPLRYTNCAHSSISHWDASAPLAALAHLRHVSHKLVHYNDVVHPSWTAADLCLPKLADRFLGPVIHAYILAEVARQPTACDGVPWETAPALGGSAYALAADAVEAVAAIQSELTEWAAASGADS